MKYFLAVLTIIAEFIVYSMICGAMEWRAGGGILINLLMFAIYGATWRAIVKKVGKDNPSSSDKSEDNID